MTHEHNIIDTDKRFIIDPIDKTITNPSGNKNVVVQYDHNSEVFTFQIPKTIEGHNMTEVDLIQIHYINTSYGTSASVRTSNPGIYTVNDIKVDAKDENLAVFTWPLSDNGTQLSGTISFQIKFICYGDEPGIPSYKWQTKVFSAINVEAGINNSEVIVEDNPDIILAFEERIAALEKGGGGGSADLSGYVPTSRSIAGIDLTDDVAVDDLQKALTVYPVLKTEGLVLGEMYKVAGEIGQMLINNTRSGTEVYQCYGIEGNKYWWEPIPGFSTLSHQPFGDPNSAPSARVPWGNMVYKSIIGNEALWICVYTDDQNESTWVRIPLMANVVTEVNETSTDKQIPSAKLFYDTIGDIETALDSIIAIQESLIGGVSE